MKVLISPISLEEARLVMEGGADIIDIKNVAEGSLGAQFPWVVEEVVQYLMGQGIETSATLGDLPYKPATASLAAYGAAHCGVDYLKAGLHGISSYDEALHMMQGVGRAATMVNPDIHVVAAGYADYRRFGGLNPTDLVDAAGDAKCQGVMVDTAIKDGKNLFDAMSLDEMADFLGRGRERGMFVALAGSIKAGHLPTLQELGPDIVGIRGAVCGKADRTTSIQFELVQEFVKEASKVVAGAMS